MQATGSILGLVVASVLGATLYGERSVADTRQTDADRVIWAGGAGEVEDAAISPDGRLVSYVDLATGELHVRDLQRNRSHQVSQIAASGGEVVESAISADSKLVAVDHDESSGRYPGRPNVAALVALASATLKGVAV